MSNSKFTKVFNWLFGAWTIPEVESRKIVESSRISLTVYVSLLRTTRSPTSKGCLTNKKIILLSTSCRLPPISQLKPKDERDSMIVINDITNT